MPPDLTDDMFAALVQDKLKKKSSQGSETSPEVKQEVKSDLSELSEQHDAVRQELSEQPTVSDMGVSDEEEHTEREPARIAVEAVVPPSMSVEKPARAATGGMPKRKPTRKLSAAQESDDDTKKSKYVTVNRQAVLKAKSLMPSLRNDSDVVNACLYLIVGGEDMPQYIKDEAEAVKAQLGGDDPAVMLEEMRKFNHQMMLLERRNERLLREMQLGMVYLLGDRLNYDVGNSPTPSQVNFLWPQYDLLYRRLSAQSGQFKQEQDGVDGRERYEAINEGKEAKP